MPVRIEKALPFLREDQLQGFQMAEVNECSQVKEFHFSESEEKRQGTSFPAAVQSRFAARSLEYTARRAFGVRPQSESSSVAAALVTAMIVVHFERLTYKPLLGAFLISAVRRTMPVVADFQH